ncbi:putative import inner membrane translocase subunit TIM14, partial [Haematococcus lacustris]
MMMSNNASPLMAGLTVAAAAYAGKQVVQLYLRMKAAPPTLKSFYKIDALIRDRAVNNGTRPRRMANGQASLKGASSWSVHPYPSPGAMAHSRAWSGGLPPERAIDLGFVFIKGATEDATTCL